MIVRGGQFGGAACRLDRSGTHDELERREIIRRMCGKKGQCIKKIENTAMTGACDRRRR